MKSRELVTCNGKASFYASIYDDLRQVAMDCGWALALHGSLANDMDIMAMPWTEEAMPVEEMIKALSTIFDGNPFQDEHVKPHYDKPHNRVVYTMAIWGDYYLDISVIQSQPKTSLKKKPIDITDGFGDSYSCCPSCKKPIVNVWNTAKYKPNNCHYCGQAFDWGEEDGKTN